MQAVLAARPTVVRADRSASTKVVCKAVAPRDVISKVASAITLLAASPAMALVDDRLAGEGTGLPFGINDGAIVANMAFIFVGVWAAYYAATRELGGQDEEDGLSL